MYYLDVKGNGTGDVFVCGDFSAEIGLGSGGSEYEEFSVLAKSSKDELFVLDTLKKMPMELQYATTPEDDDATPSYVHSNDLE